ncbi:ABC transporter substrate-binding protein [Streptomyces sp. NPDC049881]|uniref:nSTAND3 domain-containing NTPase n=1 Tax=Streptomyces sp. NPDC049881 TaxID=3155778 RepID=UPI0034212468
MAGNAATGSGDQYNISFILSEVAARLGTRSQDPRTVAAQDLRWLHQRFVHPRGFRKADEVLRERRTVVLSGHAGHGRRTAALMLLYELSASSEGMHEIDPGTGEDGVELDHRSVGEEDRLLLDLSTGDTSLHRRVQPALSSFRAVVEERRAHLVIIVPEHLAPTLSPELGQLTVTIGRPPADELLMRHLRREGITPAADEISSAPALTRFLADARLRDVARLARLVRQAREAAPQGRFADWWRGPLAEISADGSAAAKFIAKRTDGRQRALALTVAMFHGCPPDTVYAALDVLLQRVKHPEDERPRLDRSDLTTELDGIKARDVPDAGVRFILPGHDSAVLRHFWTYFPDLRPKFREWVEVCVRTLELAPERRKEIIDRFADQSLRTGHPEELMELVTAWTGSGTGQRLVPDATQLLAEGLRRGPESRNLRQQILDRARETGRPHAFRLTLTMACAQVMAVTHPDQALVRLHHLARHETSAERRPARDALLDLAVTESRLCGLLLGRLHHRLDQGRYPSPDTEIFLELAHRVSKNGPLRRATSLMTRMTECWADVLRRAPYERWAPHVPRWLESARTAGEDRDRLLAALATAGAAQPQAAAQMYVISQGWARIAASDDTEHTDRHAVADRFLAALDTAQGVGATVPQGSRPEEAVV